MSDTNKDGIVVAVIAVVFLVVGAGGGWYVRHLKAGRDAAEQQAQHVEVMAKVKSAVLALQTLADSATARSAQLGKKYNELAAQDNTDTIYLRAHEWWSRNTSADSVRRYLGTRPDGLLRRWYPGKGSLDPGSPQ